MTWAAGRVWLHQHVGRHLAHAGLRLGVVLTHGAPLAYEVYAAGAALIWGLVLVWPPADTFASASSYRLLATLAPEPVWGGVLLGLGAGQGAAILADTAIGRRAGALLGWCWWAFVGVTLILSNPATIAGWIYLWMAAGEWWTAIRLGGSRPWSRRSRW